MHCLVSYSIIFVLDIFPKIYATYVNFVERYAFALLYWTFYHRFPRYFVAKDVYALLLKSLSEQKPGLNPMGVTQKFAQTKKGKKYFRQVLLTRARNKKGQKVHKFVGK